MPSTDAVISASPGKTPVTIPLGATDAVRVGPAGFVAVQVMTRCVRSPASAPLASLADSTNVSVAAARSDGAGSGVSVTVATRRITRAEPDPLFRPVVAVTTAVPGLTAVAAPVVGFTESTAGLSVAQ